MLVKNFLLLSAALAVAVVSAADIDKKPTFLRHNKKAGRELKKEKKNKDNKNKNGGGEGTSRTNFILPNFTDRNPTFNKHNGFIPQIGHTGKNGEVIPVGTSTTGNGGGTDNAVVNKTPNNGEATANGQVDNIDNNDNNDTDNGESESGFDCRGDESGKCCTSHDQCPNSGCCTGWYGCVNKGTAAYDRKCGAANR